jgi:pimeloyl-ACP methyl ester carboxylesterase
MPFVEIGSSSLEYVEIDGARADLPTIVMLHEGLGSVSLWRDFPRSVARVTGQRVLVYSRAGYGRSTPLTGPRTPRYMHDEALIVLPQLLDRMAIERPLLFGHSDGASIALIYAGGSGRKVSGLVLLAPHVIVEDLSVTSIAAVGRAYETTDLRGKLSRHHEHVDSMFRGWNEIWLDPAFRNWAIEEYLPRISCPVLAIQGYDDEFGTMEQIERIRRAMPQAELLQLADCRHSPHRDQPEAVLEAAARFTSRLFAA